jgi:hypothetical protein
VEVIAAAVLLTVEAVRRIDYWGDYYLEAVAISLLVVTT